MHDSWKLTLVGIGIVIGFLIMTAPRSDYRDQCVVCKPSGKLAYWGECE